MKRAGGENAASGISLENEEALFKETQAVIMGIDEAGRGPLAGPVFAAAVAFRDLSEARKLLDGTWREVVDSKKLSESKRDELSILIKCEPCCMWAVASATAEEVDALNILRATHLAMRRAALDLAERFRQSGPFAILVDGLPVKTLPFVSRNIIKGDAKALTVAAASILAKTARDSYCMEMHARYPQYGFDSHKGYPTKEHIAALRRAGPCPEHRRSFGPVREVLETLPGLENEK